MLNKSKNNQKTRQEEIWAEEKKIRDEKTLQLELTNMRTWEAAYDKLKLQERQADDIALQNKLDGIQTTLFATATLFAVLADMQEEGSRRQKSLAIVSVIIDTAAAIMGVWRFWGDKGPWGIAAGVLQTIAMVAIAAKQIQNINSAESGQISTGGQPSQPAAPAFNVVGQSSTNQLAETLAANNVEPVKAYVVGSEVSTQQGLDRQIGLNASLG